MKIDLRSIVAPALASVLMIVPVSALQSTSEISSESAQQPAPAPSPLPEGLVAQSVSPSNLVAYLHLQNYLQPNWDQDAIASPLLALARTENLGEQERFDLAQLNYMAFEAQTAYDLFAEFTGRDDWYGWMARTRHMTMEARAFQDFETLEKTVANERRNHPFDPKFASVVGSGERSLCAHWAETGEHERAVDLAVKTANATPHDAPYGTLYVAGSCFKSFVETGRQSTAFALAQEARDGLAATLKKRATKSDEHPAYDLGAFENIIDDRWYNRSTRAPYNYTNEKLEQMISWFDAFLACRRDEAPGACPGE